MPAFVVPLAMMAASAISGALANKGQKQTSMPKYDPKYSPIQDALIANVLARLRQPSALPRGYEAGQIREINNTYDMASKGLDNRLVSRGLATSPVAGNALTTMALGRAGNIASMQGSLPMVERTFRNQDMAMGQQVLSMGRGTEGTTPSNMVGGAFQSGADMLAYLYGKGAFTTGAKQPLAGRPLPVQYLPLPTAPAGNYPG